VTFTPFGGGGAAGAADAVALFTAALADELVALSDEEHPTVEAKAIAPSQATPACAFLGERASIRVAGIAISIFDLRMESLLTLVVPSRGAIGAR